MSKRSTRSITASDRANREKNYKLFVVQFHGNGLIPIRDKLVERIKVGLRRRLFIIDLEEETNNFNKIRQSRGKGRMGGGSSQQTIDEVVVALASIEYRCQQYDIITKSIEEEVKFDIYRYWLDNVISIEASLLPDRKSDQGKKAVPNRKKTLEPIPERISKKGAKSAPLLEKQHEPLECPTIRKRAHHKVGKGIPFSKRKFIEDEPQPSKLFIVLLLRTHHSKLCMELSRIGEPLQAIIHFTPDRGPYDLLVPQTRNEGFIRYTLKDIKSSFDSLRIPKIMKPVGLLQQPLPVLSRCLAEKYADLIYDQMSWFFYDIELIYQRYQLYYVAPFKETNIEMNRNVNIQTLIDTAESLTIQGQYLNSPLPAAATDIATIVVFLEGLLSTIEKPAEIIFDDLEQLIRDSSHPGNASITSLYPTGLKGFSSITKVKRFDRLVVERINTLFCALVSFMDLDYFPSIYRSCLEYSILRRYILPLDVIGCERINTLQIEPCYLPPYSKLFLTHDSVMQRLTDLITTYDQYEVGTLFPGHSLYHFKRYYNEIIQQEKMVILPSRLCFRDFTLFQLEEFLNNMVTPEQRRLITETRQRESEKEQKKLLKFSIDINIFIRPRSLKAQTAPAEISKRPSQAPPQMSQRKTKESLVREPRATSVIENYVGLPPGHPMLKGYNLEDVRQEVYIKSSVYNFDEGSLKLYEDRWCWDNLNKNIHLIINQCKINFHRPRFSSEGSSTGISRNVQIQTKNDVICRILATEKECAQIVINYPNGLSVYYHANFTEQLWNLQETLNNESKRLMIPEGAVIIFYLTEDIIRILRHNGEVYELIQYECPVSEEDFELEEEEIEDLVPKSTSEHTPVPSNWNRDSFPSSKRSISARASSINASSTKRQSNAISSKIRKNNLIHIIENELRFLNMIMAKYGLTYKCLKVTTAGGRVLQITNNGKASGKTILKNEEWHDYFADESYAMRSDGVKMIWTKDALKCFHEDGTIITSGMGESLEALLWDDEFDISLNSSNFMKEELEEGGQIWHRNRLTSRIPTMRDADNIHQITKTRGLGIKGDTYRHFIFSEHEEEHIRIQDDRYVCYQNEKFLIQHKSYAAVNFVILQHICFGNKSIMKIFAADSIGVQITLEDAESSSLRELGKYDDIGAGEGSDEIGNKLLRCKSKDVIPNNDKHVRGDASKCGGNVDHSLNYQGEHRQRDTQHSRGDGDQTSDIDMTEVLKMSKSTIKVNIGTEVEIKLTNDTCRIRAVIERNDELCGKVRDILHLGFQFDDDILSLFHDFVKTISNYKNYVKSETCSDFYFLRKDSKDCTQSQGFEFYESLPILGEYSMTTGNKTIDLRAFQTVTDLMSNKYEWFAKDIKKFPRLQKRKEKKPSIGGVAGVLTADIYCKIPRLLRNTEDIEKFVDPFTTISFKRTRHHLKSAIYYYMYPKERIKLKALASKIRWKRRHVEHARRLLIEIQRRGLYHAMLKHKMYPTYYEFVNKYVGHVSNIDFFDYIQYKCILKNQMQPLLTEMKSTKNKF